MKTSYHLCRDLLNALLLTGSVFLAGCQPHKTGGNADAHLAVQQVQRSLEPKLARIDDHPVGEEAIAQGLQQFVAALSSIDTGNCPADFKAQYTASLASWRSAAQSVAEESSYLGQHPDEDPERGGKPGVGAAERVFRSNQAMDHALAENQHLREVALHYGVAWH